MEPLVIAAAALLGAVGGAVLGMLARTYWSSQSMKAAHAEARRIEAEARARQKELILEAKDEKLRMQREAEDEARSRRGELSALERRLLQRDEQLDQRTDMLEQRDRKLLERELDIDRAREEVAKAHLEQVAALERVSNVSAEDAKALLLEAVREEAEHDAVKIARAIERSAREDAQDKARDIVVTAIQRVAADHTAEHTVSIVHLPSDEMKGRIIGREGRNIRALEQATGIDLIIDDTPETVILSGFDPVRREIARIAITKLIADGRIHPGRIEEVVAKARAEVDTIMRQAGEQAAYEAGVPGLPADIVKTLGRLKFRTSYGQNVLNHVVETSHLAAVGLEDRLLAGLADRVLDLRLGLVVHLLDPRRVDAPVLDQLREGQLRHLAPNAVKRRKHDRLRRVVDDHVDPGEVLERADVAAFAADDPALHIVGRKLDERDGGLGGVVGSHALEGVGDEVAGAALRLCARLLLGLPHLACHFVADELLGAFEQVRLGLVDRHARDALELCDLRVAGVLEVFLELLGVHLAVEDALLAPGELGQLLVDVLLLRQHALLDLEDLRAALGDLLLDLGPQPNRGLARFDLALPAQRVGLALRLAPHHFRLALALADEQLARSPRGGQA